MLGALVRFAVRFHGVIVGLACTVLLYGGYALSRAGLDIFPEFAPKQVIVQTEAPGLSAGEVELLVTQPIENALAGLIGLRYLRSESIQGLSVVTLVFAEDTDIHRNRQLVGDRLAALSGILPEGIRAPTAVPLSSSSATVLTIGLTSHRRSLMTLRDHVDWTLVPRLMTVPGVADVNVFGGEVRQLQIQLDPDALTRYGLSVQDIKEAGRLATGIRGGGFIENENQRLALTITGQPITATELENVVVRQGDGGNIRLGDVARVRIAAAPPIGAAQVMGEPGIVMMVIGQYGANTLTVSRQVEAVLDEFEPILAAQDITLHKALFRPANYIETSVKNLSGHLLVGGLFVAIVLFLFLFNFQTALISILAIPLSLLGAVVVLLESGVNLNIMVLGGLAIALGEVVDDAIIDTENVYRRLRENRRLTTPRPSSRVVWEASMEVRGSVVYASFIVALVFVPLLTLGGVAGRLFSPLGYSYILAILMSLAVALTVTPALCYLLLSRTTLRESDPPLIRWLKPLYGGLVRRFCAVPRTTIAVSLVMSAIGAALLPTLGGKFLPDLREGHYMVHTASKPGTSLEESIRIGTALTAAFLEIHGVRSVSQWAGRAERGADTYGSHYSEYEVDLEPLPGAGQQRVLEQLREVLREFPGIVFEANTFLIERVDETISGYSAPVVINLYGSDLDVLDRKAQEVAAAVRRMPGAEDVQLRSPRGTPQVQIRLRSAQLARWGIRPIEVMEALQVAYEGSVVGHVARGNRIQDVTVILKPELRRRIADLERLPVRAASGQLIPLAHVAEIRQTGDRYNILHQGGQRLQTVTANFSGEDLASFVQQLKQRIRDAVLFDADTYPEFTGAAVEQARSRERLILHSLLAGVGVLALIYIALGSLRHMALVMVNLPFSLLGGVLAVLLTGGIVSAGSLVGFVTLFGITVRNSIMLMSHYHHLVEREQQEWNLQTAVRGAQERLPSILMTALVTALAMLPIAVDSDNAGREIMGPMAAIIIGGLVSSTLLNLLILPPIMLRYGKFATPQAAA